MSNATILDTNVMFRRLMSHLQALMIQIHTKNVLIAVRSPTLTISVVNDNESE